MLLFDGYSLFEGLFELLDLNLPPYILAFLFNINIIVFMLPGNQFNVLLLDSIIDLFN